MAPRIDTLASQKLNKKKGKVGENISCFLLDTFVIRLRHNTNVTRQKISPENLTSFDLFFTVSNCQKITMREQRINIIVKILAYTNQNNKQAKNEAIFICFA